MRKPAGHLLLVSALCAGCPAWAGQGEIVFAITASNTMPLGLIENNAVVGGILKDLGDAIAARLKRKPVYVTLPRMQLMKAVEIGDADVRCYSRPKWDPGSDVHWSRPLIPSGDIIAIRRGAKRPPDLKGLVGMRVGTVTGYQYPLLDEATESRYVRDDGPTETANVKKLASGRFDYAVVSKLFFQYHFRTHEDRERLEATGLPVETYEAPCAISKKSTIPLTELNQAIEETVASGKLAEILARYR